MGRCLLAHQTAFLFRLDETWTLQNIIPLFSDQDPQKFLQVWNGFLAQSRLYPTLAEKLEQACLNALKRLDELRDQREHFIEFFTYMLVYYVTDPRQSLLPGLFGCGEIKDRQNFASNIRKYRGQMQSPFKDALWKRWLKAYWEDRRQGLLKPLDDHGEIQIMLEWIPMLGDNFPDAVDLASSLPAVELKHSRVLHELGSSELIDIFPVEVAKLLIYLAKGMNFNDFQSH